MRTPRSTSGAEAPPPHPRPPAAAGVQALRGRRAHAGPPADERAEPGTAHGPAGPPRSEAARRPGERRHLRPRTVRAKIISLLMVPVVSLLALWGFATVTTAQDIARLRQLQDVENRVRGPVADAVYALQDERRAALRQITAPGSQGAADLRSRAKATDAALAALLLDPSHTVAEGGELPRDVGRRLSALVAHGRQLAALRVSVLDRRTGWDSAYEKYTAAIGAGFGVTGALAGVQDSGTGSDARVLLEFARAGEMLAREDALLTAARTAESFGSGRLRRFAGAVETRRALTESAAADLPPGERAAWRELTAQGAYRALRSAEDATAAAPAGRRAAAAVPAATWDSAHGAVRAGMRDIETSAWRGAADRADPVGQGVFTAAGAAVLLGLAAVAASLAISVRIGRALVVELVGLRNTALEIARHKLPQAMSRLRAGEDIDVRSEAPPGPPPLDEIAEVGEALSTVHRAALSAAVERAELSRGISGVFVNLARRSQVLVHRQLTLLDGMERRAEDPGELGDLFRLDHLTTRMRRHAESLIILSGAAPGRAWRMPVPLTNVVRAAVSEIEDYARVEVRQLPEAAVVGAAVADLTHLLAELVENAAQFSPPHTKVRVSGEPVGNGYALEIEDRGLGMGKEALADANRRIEESEALDLFDSDRLGLFVVSRLSARHDIRVELRTSPYGGTTAVVLIPTALLQSAQPAGAAPPAAASHGAEHAPAREPATHSAPYAVPDPARAPARQGGQSPPGRPGPQGVEARSPGADPPPGVIALRLRDRTASPPPDGPRPESHRPESHRPENHRPESDRPGSARPEIHRPGSPRPGSFPAGPPARGDTPGKPSSADTGGLPRRVRQASLVPQLRAASQPEPADPARHDAPERTPEEVRDRMTAYRAGWARGGGAAPGSPTHTSAHRSEGDHR
ncbi:sensor histidine kinase [Streptomyces tirandamycinicus]|uniref:sensor histidine kinase n=1 Tax=Streptomyces tirandamycinicus TaxID=2174846 RepID=UPI00226D80BD|nr:nitrate- and nitrite sensing domain-containing protein [Streptomyces tirandamycinicus]MCY0982148.1 nitrate- and nitrite sensing domain-containing protein [Streptomyces tirandamycinicus]